MTTAAQLRAPMAARPATVCTPQAKAQNTLTCQPESGPCNARPQTHLVRRPRLAMRASQDTARVSD
jgi:hypothetical protein